MRHLSAENILCEPQRRLGNKDPNLPKNCTLKAYNLGLHKKCMSTHKLESKSIRNNKYLVQSAVGLREDEGLLKLLRQTQFYMLIKYVSTRGVTAFYANICIIILKINKTNHFVLDII